MYVVIYKNPRDRRWSCSINVYMSREEAQREFVDRHPYPGRKFSICYVEPE